MTAIVDREETVADVAARCMPANATARTIEYALKLMVPLQDYRNISNETIMDVMAGVMRDDCDSPTMRFALTLYTALTAR